MSTTATKMAERKLTKRSLAEPRAQAGRHAKSWRKNLRPAEAAAAVVGSTVLDESGRATYVLVRIDEYERLVKASMVESAVGKLQKADETRWTDADGLRINLAAERIAEARKKAGLTQQELGKKLNLPQSQVSRIERNPDHTTVRTLKRVARALGVDVGALI